MIFLRTAFDRLCILPALLACGIAGAAHAQDAVYDDKVSVTADTRLDWVYPILGKSPAEPPPGLLDNYVATSQSFEYFGPVENPGGPMPLVIFVSPSDRPVGWEFWEPACRAHGVLFAGLREMGNGQPGAERARAVLDVLDELRERFNIDPDRTYLSGFSGGGQIACAVALALPEYFGGVVCIGHAPPPPQLPWHVDRARQRLSMAILNGENDSTTPLVEDLYGPWWQGIGVRTAPITVRGIGHTMPEARLIEQAYQWLEEGLADRRAKAAARPALRIADVPTRSEWADRQLADAQRLLETADASHIEVALQQLQGLVARWDDVPAAAAAQQLIADYTARKERPWEAVRTAENLHLLELGAAGYDDLAFDGRRAVRSDRGKHAKVAIGLWEQLRNGAVGDEELRAHAAERIAALEKVVAEAPATSNRVSLTRVRFNMEGDVTLLQGIEHMRGALAPLGYQLRFDEQALRAAGVDLDAPRKPRIKAGTFKEIDERFFRRAGVRLRRNEGVVEIVPWKPPSTVTNAPLEATNGEQSKDK